MHSRAKPCPVRVESFLLSCLVMLLAVAGCGGDGGDGPPPPPECAISQVNTSQRDSWLSGDNVDIRWTGNGVPGTVAIDLLKAGNVVATIAAATDNDGFYPWSADTGGQANGSDFGIRVTATGNAGCGDEVNGLTILDVTGCSFEFTSGLTDTLAGTQSEITWTSNNTSGLVDIELWTSGFGSTLGDLVGTVAVDAPDDGSLTWTLDSFNNGTYSFYRYVIRDAQVAGCEAMSRQFTIVDSVLCTTSISGPSSQPMQNGDQMSIRLEQVNGSGVVTLLLYAGGEFVPGGVIGTDISVLDDMVWTVTDFGFTGDNTRYNIRSVDSQDPYCIDRSDNFTILR